VKALGYTRVSREEQAVNGSISLETQADALRDLCGRKGVDLVDIITDRGYSARNDKRPGFQQVRRAALAGEVQAVVAYRLDRLTRNLRDLTALFGDGGELQKRGVAFLSASEEFDTSTPAGAAMMNMLGVFAQFERETISARQKAQVAYRQKVKGEWWGAVPYGWRAPEGKHRERAAWVQVPEQQRVLRRIRAWRAKGRALRWIADTLNTEGVPSPRGGRWSHVALLKMLR